MEGWIIKLLRFHRINVVSFELVTGYLWMPHIRAYLPPSKIDHLPYLEKDLNRFPDGDPIHLGDLNVDIGRLRHHRDRKIDDFLASFELVDIM